MNTNNIDKVLGQRVDSPTTYTPDILVREERQRNRTYLNIQNDDLPFVGYDIWNGYECSAMTEGGLPVACVAKVVYSATNPYIVESKSMKLYWNGFNMQPMGKNVKEVLKNIKATAEKDLIPDEERWIADYARKNLNSDLVYAVDFPAEAGKFYHKFKDDGTVAWGDLLFRGLEIATVPLRENNYEKMIEQMTAKGLDVSHEGFKYYLQAFKYGLPQHGGCGFGVDRLVQKTLGLGNVKEATLFPRDINRLAP